MAIENRALTKWQTLRDDLGLSGDSKQEALKRTVMVATDKIEEIANRSFARSTGIVDRLRVLGDQWLYAKTYPIRSITSIRYGDGTDAASLVDASWYDWETRKASGMIQFLVAPPRRTSVIDRISLDVQTGTEWFDYRLEYDGGWMTPLQDDNDDPDDAPRDLPFGIEELCLRLATFYWRQRGRDPGVRQLSVGSGSVAYSKRRDGIPEDLYDEIRDLRRPAVA